ncbi:hypothetical protein ACHAXR_004417, partial [Thalassiosira sp. AJA248-18]
MRSLSSRVNLLSCILFQCCSITAITAFVASSDDATDTSTVVAEHPNCRLFLAESTIPNAGLGIYSGVDLQPGEAVAEPDIVIPLHDAEWHSFADVDFFWLWRDYSWQTDQVGMQYDVVEGSAIVIGTGCMPNCNFAVLNAHEGTPDYDHAGLHRSKDVGISGFTGFYNQKMFTTREIHAGGEIFVDYGEPWFEDRTKEVGAVPYLKHFKRADKLLKKFKKLTLKYQKSDNPDFTRDLWDVVKTQAKYDTRNSNALPLTFEDMRSAQTIGSAESRHPYTIRTLEWLNEHGRCMDNIRPGNSTIKQAGRGAFATRFIPEGGLVAPGPVLHIANRTSLNLYEMGEDGSRDTNRPDGMQLLLNYCFGHHKSTVILCPYTSPSAYINHNSKSPNTKVVWAKDSTPNHNSYWLEENVTFLKSMASIGLSIDYVATRDIEPGEEVFIDYGPEWEQSWDKYVKEWTPPAGSETFVSAAIMQKDLYTPLRTETEQLPEPYPENIVFYCHYGYEPGVPEGPWEWVDEWAFLPTCPCDIISREAGEVDNDGNTAYYYTAVIWNEDELGDDTINKMEHDIPSGQNHILTDVPRWAIEIQDRLYSKDEF